MPAAAPDFFSDALRREIIGSEQRRMRVLALILAALLALSLAVANLFPSYTSRIFERDVPGWLPFIGIGPFLLYELGSLTFLGYRASRGLDFPRLGRFGNAFIETSLPAAIIITLSHYMDPLLVFSFWPPLLYFIFILLSTLRLDFLAVGLDRKCRGRAADGAGAVAAADRTVGQHSTGNTAVPLQPDPRPVHQRPGCRVRCQQPAQSVREVGARGGGARPRHQPFRPACLAGGGRPAAGHAKRAAERDPHRLRAVPRHQGLHRDDRRRSAEETGGERIEVEVLACDGRLVEHGRRDTPRLEGVDHHGRDTHRRQLAHVACLALADAAAAVMDHHRRHRCCRIGRPSDFSRDPDGLTLLAALEGDGLALLCLYRRRKSGTGEHGAGGGACRPQHLGRNLLLLGGDLVGHRVVAGQFGHVFLVPEVQLDHHAIGIVDEDLLQRTRRHLLHLEGHAVLLDLVERAADVGAVDGDMVDGAAALVGATGFRNEMQDRLLRRRTSRRRERGTGGRSPLVRPT
ncbi:hypothetical protein OSTOST_13923 [Ostertagia ostertagi]